MRHKLLIGLVVGAFALGACATTVKTNAQKCADAGGSYNARTDSCQFQSETPRK